MHPTIPLCLDKIPFDYLELDPKEQFSGVYAYYCTCNNKFYIGSTKNFLPINNEKEHLKGRKAEHLNSLRNSSHGNPILQRAFGKYGELNFYWFKLEGGVERKDLIAREDFYLAKYRPFDKTIGFNINQKASGGNPNFKPIVGCYKFVKFSGEIIEGENITKFARENKLQRRFLSELIGRKRDYYKGLILFENIHRLEDIMSAVKENEFNRTYYKLISPTGEIVEGYDREAFCKKYNMKLRHLSDVIADRCDSILGWRLFVPGKHPNRNLTQEELKILQDEVKERGLRSFIKETEVRLNGEKIKIFNVEDYCRRNRLSHDSMLKIVNGTRNTEYCGYTSADEELHLKQVNNSIKAIAIDTDGRFTKIRGISDFCKLSSTNLTNVRYYSKNNKWLNGCYFVIDTQGFTERERVCLLADKKSLLFPDNPNLELKEISNQEFITALDIYRNSQLLLQNCK